MQNTCSEPGVQRPWLKNLYRGPHRLLQVSWQRENWAAVIYKGLAVFQKSSCVLLNMEEDPQTSPPPPCCAKHQPGDKHVIRQHNTARVRCALNNYFILYTTQVTFGTDVITWSLLSSVLLAAYQQLLRRVFFSSLYKWLQRMRTYSVSPKTSVIRKSTMTKVRLTTNICNHSHSFYQLLRALVHLL